MTHRLLCTRFIVFLFCAAAVMSCAKPDTTKPTVGYLLMFEDATLDRARQGFLDALKDAGYEDGKTVTIIYRNAQGDVNVMSQALDYFIAQKVSLIATNPTVPTIAAIQKTSTIPVCMMVAPRPDIGKFALEDGTYPKNLCGTYETLAYIDTSLALIKQLFPNAKRVGVLFNSSEPNSVNAMQRLKGASRVLNLDIISASVSATNETQQVALSMVENNIDVFFAQPDNILFSSFETIYAAMSAKKIPIVSSEAGLVSRGAFAAYGADMYAWGKQAGAQAARILKGETNVAPDEVRLRVRIYNDQTRTALGFDVPKGFDKF
jgi:putative tryptophan/tyrosine transport system substrate-binding protein